jgi:hypothetical protein
MVRFEWLNMLSIRRVWGKYVAGWRVTWKQEHLYFRQSISDNCGFLVLVIKNKVSRWWSLSGRIDARRTNGWAACLCRISADVLATRF